MVGMKKATDAIFTNQHYGSGKVIENTILAAEKAGLTVGLSDLYVDIDTKEDLKLLYERIESDEYECPNTKKYIDEVIKERLDEFMLDKNIVDSYINRKEFKEFFGVSEDYKLESELLGRGQYNINYLFSLEDGTKRVIDLTQRARWI